MIICEVVVELSLLCQEA